MWIRAAAAACLLFALASNPLAAQPAAEARTEALRYRDAAFGALADGEFDEALALGFKAEELARRAFGPQSAAYASTLILLASVLSEQGQPGVARPFAVKAIAVLEAAGAAADLPAYLSRLATIETALGDTAAAQAALERALALEEKQKGPAHPEVALQLGHLAAHHLGVARARGGDDAPARFEKAFALLQRKLAIEAAALGEQHADYGATLQLMAEVMRTLATYVEDAAARRAAGTRIAAMLERALAIREQALGKDHPKLVDALDSLGAQYRDLGEHAPARRHFERSLAIQSARAPGERFGRIRTLANTAVLAAAAGEREETLRLCRSLLDLEEQQIATFFFHTDEKQKLGFIETIGAHASLCLAAMRAPGAASPEFVRLGLETLLRRKGIVLDAQTSLLPRGSNNLPEKARASLAGLRKAREALARLALAGPRNAEDRGYAARVEALEKEARDFELLAGLQGGGQEFVWQRDAISAAAVARALPAGAVLVEFARSPGFDFRRVLWEGSAQYLAFVLRPDASLALISLGSAAALEDEVRRAREALNANLAAVLPAEISATGRKAKEALARLHALLWRPLEAALGGAEHVYLSPDGELNVVPFAALADAAGRPIVERHRISFLTSGRDLLRQRASPPANAADLVLVADPAFDAPGAAQAGARPPLRQALPKFDPLPGTAREAKDVPAALGGGAARRHVLLGAQASKAALRALPRPRILHFATHGFFLEDLPAPAGPDLRLGANAAAAGAPMQNPLVRSGLALAGANRAAEGDPSGILTALEVLDLDLEGTELVVLSACETGLGEVRTGEGVFGLRRAFALAGAGALLMSLWPVADDIAAEQMRDFYANLRSLPAAEALRLAQLASLRRLEAGGAEARPALWAPFILQGR